MSVVFLLEGTPEAKRTSKGAIHEPDVLLPRYDLLVATQWYVIKV
tara:strand:- start:2198 stop:2332 length:135 start_codon:yes stop_codon:yes gene_type:complete